MPPGARPAAAREVQSPVSPPSLVPSSALPLPPAPPSPLLLRCELSPIPAPQPERIIIPFIPEFLSSCSWKMGNIPLTSNRLDVGINVGFVPDSS